MPELVNNMKNLLFVLLSFTIFSSSAFADEPMISKEEMMSRIDGGTISFDKTFFLPLQDKDKNGKTVYVPQDKAVAHLLSKNPSLKEEYLYILVRRTNQWEYAISYDYYARKCMFRAGKFKKSGSSPTEYEITPLFIKGEEVPMKYCEKLYGVKLK